MSSKSRKHSSPTPARKRPDSPAVPEPEHHESIQVAGVELSDDLVHVPKERSPLFFLLMIALLIFLLIIFIVPSALLGVAGGGSKPEGVPDYLSYDVPVDGKLVHEEMDQGAFIRRRLLIDKVLEFDPLLLLNMGIFGGRSSRMEEEDHARLVYLDRLAEASGVFVPRSDLGEHLGALVKRAFNGNIERYKTYFLSGRDGITTNEFEGELANMIRVERFMTMIGDIPYLADPDWIEETWKKEHIEDRYVFAEVEVSSLEEVVRTEGVDDETLSTWFEGLDDFRRERYRTEEKRVVTLAHVDDITAFDPSALFAKYPPAEDVDEDSQANDYYNRVFLDRFLFDPTENMVGPQDEGAAQTAPDKAFLEFDEVAEIARLEAPIYFALEAWSNDLVDRTLAGEEVSLKAEAEALGIPTTTTEALSDTELRERETLGGPGVADPVARTVAGALGSTLFVTEDSFGLFQVDSVEPAEIPPLQAVRDEVFDEWVIEKAQERALEMLAEIRDGFEEFVPQTDEDTPPLTDSQGEQISPRRRADEATFQTALEGAGLVPSVRDWVDRRGRVTDDPQASEPAHIFLRSNRTAQGAVVDEVIPPALDSSLKYAYLVRKDGQREVPLDRMAPQEYANYKNQSARSSGSAVRDALDFEFLAQRFNLKVFDARTDEERARDEARAQRKKAEQ